eukprot:scaffold34178_cov40-Prasinocladus_malaysianus.AAC.2
MSQARTLRRPLLRSYTTYICQLYVWASGWLDDDVGERQRTHNDTTSSPPDDRLTDEHTTVASTSHGDT